MERVIAGEPSWIYHPELGLCRAEYIAEDGDYVVAHMDSARWLFLRDDAMMVGNVIYLTRKPMVKTE